MLAANLTKLCSTDSAVADIINDNLDSASKELLEDTTLVFLISYPLHLALDSRRSFSFT